MLSEAVLLPHLLYKLPLSVLLQKFRLTKHRGTAPFGCPCLPLLLPVCLSLFTLIPADARVLPESPTFIYISIR